MKTYLDEWKEAVQRAESVGAEIRELKRRTDENRRQWREDEIAEHRTESRAYAQRPSKHDD